MQALRTHAQEYLKRMQRSFVTQNSQMKPLVRHSCPCIPAAISNPLRKRRMKPLSHRGMLPCGTWRYCCSLRTRCNVWPSADKPRYWLEAGFRKSHQFPCVELSARCLPPVMPAWHCAEWCLVSKTSWGTPSPSSSRYQFFQA